MQAKPYSLSSQYSELLRKFAEYLLLQRERDQSTVQDYGYDAKTYLNYRLEMGDIDLPYLFTPDFFTGYVVYLRKHGLNNSTIKRRLIGAMQFWKFLYKCKIVLHPPVSLDDMDIVVKKVRNPTCPLSPENFSMLRTEALNGLQFIH
jgi:site-specific recombinase XerD